MREGTKEVKWKICFGCIGAYGNRQSFRFSIVIYQSKPHIKKMCSMDWLVEVAIERAIFTPYYGIEVYRRYAHRPSNSSDARERTFWPLFSRRSFVQSIFGPGSRIYNVRFGQWRPILHEWPVIDWLPFSNLFFIPSFILFYFIFGR